MAQMTFPEPTICHCRDCGCQQWFYPHECLIPKVVLCWRCRGQEFADLEDEDADGEIVNAPAAPAIPVQMSLF